MFRRLLAVLAAVLSLHASANTFSSDATDLWWNANESGWGVNINHQGEVIFATFFVYGSSTSPLWLSVSMTYTGTTGGALVFSGPLYQTNGPGFAGAFNPNLVTYRQVGTATFTMNTIGTATLTYSVDGANVTKALTRYSFRNNNLTGTFVGASVGTYSNCRAPFVGGYAERSATFVVTQNGTSVTMQVADSAGAQCTYTGTYAPNGRTGIINGNYTCTSSASGTFQASEVDANLQGFTARVTAADNFCNFSGRFAGAKTGA